MISTNSKISDGFTDFETMVNSDLFIDKTLFIRRVIKSSTSHFVFTRPRRWGKSMNISMLKKFLEKATDIQGNILSNKSNYNVFNGSTEKIKALKIYSENEIDFQFLIDTLNGKIEELKKKDIDFGEIALKLENDDWEQWNNEKANIISKYYCSLHPYDANEEEIIMQVLIKHFASFKDILITESNCEILPQVSFKVMEWSNSSKENERKNYYEIDRFFGFMGKHCGQYPVIYFQFQPPTDITGTEDILKQYYKCIMDAYAAHSNVYKKLMIDTIKFSDKLKNQSREGTLELLDAEALEMIFESEKIRSKTIKDFQDVRYGRFTAYALSEYIPNLMSILCEFYRTKRVWILIDEYDALINILKKKEESDYAEGLLIELLYAAVKGNSQLEKIVMVGTLRIHRANLFGGLDNFNDFTVSDTDEFSEDFGFTQEEVDYLLNRAIEGPKCTLLKNEIKCWYNGYVIGNATIYNPYSIMNCLNTAKTDPLNSIKSYWIESENVNILKDIFDRLQDYSKFVSLISKKEMVIQNDLSSLLSFDPDNPQEGDFWCYAMHCGYLTRIEGKQNRIQIPNMEIKRNFYDKVIINTWAHKRFSIDLNKLVEGFISNLEDGVALEKFIQDQIILHLGSGEKKESDFHVLIGGIVALAFLDPDRLYYPLSEVISARKRMDNVFLPAKTQTKIVIIHEYKELGTSTHVDLALQEALWQIIGNNYIAMVTPLLSYQNWESIIIRGMVFYQTIPGHTFKCKIKEYVIAISVAPNLVQLVRRAQEMFSKLPRNKQDDFQGFFLMTYNKSTLDEFMEYICGLDFNDNDLPHYIKHNLPKKAPKKITKKKK